MRPPPVPPIPPLTGPPPGSLAAMQQAVAAAAAASGGAGGPGFPHLPGLAGHGVGGLGLPPSPLSALTAAARGSAAAAAAAAAAAGLPPPPTSLGTPMRRRMIDKAPIPMTNGLPYMFDRAGLDIAQGMSTFPPTQKKSKVNIVRPALVTCFHDKETVENWSDYLPFLRNPP